MTLPSMAPVIRVYALPADSNAYGDIFGGWLIGQMDLGAALVAQRRCKGRAVTVGLDGMHFHHPVKIGDELSVYGKLIKEGRTSMRVAIEAWRREPHDDLAVKVTEAEFTFVAVDNEGRPRPIDQE